MPDVFSAAKGNNEQSGDATPKTKHAKHPKYKNNPLSAFMYYPRKADFIVKDREEEIILVLRKHPITNIGWITIGLLMLLAPSVLSFFPIIEILPEAYQLVAVMGWYLLTVAYVFENFLSWFFNVNIVTDERIFDVDFVNLIYREITDANIDQIQEVTVVVGSTIRTLFNYGNVMVMTAAETPEIDFVAVPHPDRVAKILRELRVEEEQEKVEGRVR